VIALTFTPRPNLAASQRKYYVFRSFKLLKILRDSPSHRIFRRIHRALNTSKKITNYTVWL
jgi:hypothetical protein